MYAHPPTRLLIVAQALDTENPVLGFFHEWVVALAARYEQVEVICLTLGRSDLHKNVRVHSLGKPSSAPDSAKATPGKKATKDREPKLLRLFLRMRYVWRFLSLAWRLRGDYDAVFVHMNQEYVLVAGWLWWLLGKRVYLWRNHYEGSWVTDIAATFCTNVFCTSTYAYTAKYKKTRLMPVGVDTKRFYPDPRATRMPRSILFFSRIAQSKRPELLIDALTLLTERGIAYTADIVGSPGAGVEAYYEALVASVRARGLAGHISFHPSVANIEAPALYRGHEIFVNCSPSGMFDKTIFEAAACGATVLAASKDFAALAGPEFSFETAEELAECLAGALGQKAPAALTELAKSHGLPVLMDQLVETVY